jgi:hypothetical protein
VTLIQKSILKRFFKHLNISDISGQGVIFSPQQYNGPVTNVHHHHGNCLKLHCTLQQMFGIKVKGLLLVNKLKINFCNFGIGKKSTYTNIVMKRFDMSNGVFNECTFLNLKRLKI